MAWAEARSEAAFTALVARHAGLVYGTALRILSNNSQAAQDVTQAVFVHLAQKASRIEPALLGAWLYRQAWYAAHKTLRQNQRRARREKEAVNMGSLESDQNPLWTELAPCLDEAMSNLNANDQAALVLRFFQQKDFRKVGEALGTSEDTAQKRVSRALEKLRQLLARQGVPVSAAALASLLAVPSSTAAPATAIASATHAAVAAGAAGTGTALALMHAMTSFKLKSAVLCALLAAGVATPLWLQHRAISALRQSNSQLQARLQTESELNAPPPPAAPGAILDTALQGDTQARELLRLRGQVAVLRRRLAELETGAAVTAKTQDGARSFIPAENLEFAGYADPVSALQTYFWSLRNADTNALLKAVSPELAATYSQALNGPEPEVIRDSLAREVADFKGYKVMDTHAKSPSMVVLTVQESGIHERRSLMTFLKINEEWRLLDRSSR